MKLCKDCRWCQWPDTSVPLRRHYEGVCAHGSSVWQEPPSPVTGEESPVLHLRCYQARSLTLEKKLCGPDAQFWEAADP